MTVPSHPPPGAAAASPSARPSRGRPAPRRGPSALGRWGRVAHRTLSAAALGVLLGCSAMPIAPGTARAQDRADAPFDGDLMYELMIAELAGRRGQLDVAMEGYLRAATRSPDARVAERAARLALFARRWSEAERAARRWIELDAQAREARELLARSLLQQDETEAAAREYVALVAMVPAIGSVEEPTEEGPTEGSTRAEILRELQGALQGEDPARAMRVMEALAEAYPEESEARLGVARLALAANDRERALEAAEAALAIDAGNADAALIRARILLASGRAEEAFDGLDAALERFPDDIALRLGHAQLLAETGRVEAALEEFERLHEAAPDDADVLLTIGLLALDAGREEPARRYLESLLESGGHPDQANFYLARIDDAAGERERAIERYEAVQPGPLYADARVRAAELHARGGDIEAGRTRLRDLAAEIPDPALQPRLLVAESRMLQQAGEAGEAVRVLSDGLERFTDDGDLLYARALAADAAGDPEMLERDLRRLIELEPDNAHALNALGYHFADTDRHLDEAAVYLEKAVALEPDDAAILDSLGWLRYRQGQLAEAETLLRRALELYPDGEIAAHLGEVLWMRGERDEARAVWEAALAETPDDDVLQRVVEKFVD